jgi:hypothetical protein
MDQKQKHQILIGQNLKKGIRLGRLITYLKTLLQKLLEFKHIVYGTLDNMVNKQIIGEYDRSCHV